MRGAGCGGRAHQRICPPARSQAPIPPDRLAASQPSPRRCWAAVREGMPLAHITTTERPWRSLRGDLSMSPRSTCTAPGACPDFHSLDSRTPSMVAPPRTSSRVRPALTVGWRLSSAGLPPNNLRSRSSTEGVGRRWAGAGVWMSWSQWAPYVQSIPYGVFSERMGVMFDRATHRGRSEPGVLDPDSPQVVSRRISRPALGLCEGS